MGYNFITDNASLSSFVWPLQLAPESAKFCEIPRNIDRIHPIAGQGHPRSSILVSIESSYATSF